MEINITIGLVIVGFVLGSVKLCGLCKSSCKTGCEMDCKMVCGMPCSKIASFILEILKAMLITSLDSHFNQQHVGFVSCLLGTSVGFIYPGLSWKIIGLLTGMFVYLSFIS